MVVRRFLFVGRGEAGLDREKYVIIMFDEVYEV
jgi:hypothetical protein